MENLYEKVVYLRGFVEGLGINEDLKEGRLFLSIIDVFDEFVDVINEFDVK